MYMISSTKARANHITTLTKPAKVAHKFRRARPGLGEPPWRPWRWPKEAAMHLPHEAVDVVAVLQEDNLPQPLLHVREPAKEHRHREPEDGDDLKEHSAQHHGPNCMGKPPDHPGRPGPPRSPPRPPRARANADATVHVG